MRYAIARWRDASALTEARIAEGRDWEWDGLLRNGGIVGGRARRPTKEGDHCTSFHKEERRRGSRPFSGLAFCDPNGGLPAMRLWRDSAQADLKQNFTSRGKLYIQILLRVKTPICKHSTVKTM